MLKTFLFSFKQVFSSPRYIVLTIIAFLVIFSFAIWLPNLNFLHHIVISDAFSSSQKVGIITSVFGSIQTNFTPLSQITIFIVAFLFGIYFSFFTYFLVRATRLSKEAGIGTSGFVLGLIGVGCASCGSVILSSFLGVATTASFIGILPLRGAEFGLLSIFLLGISIHLLSKKIKDPLICNTKPAVPTWLKIAAVVFLAFTIGVLFAERSINIEVNKQALAAKFEQLSQNGNSSCSLDFKDSISKMPDNARLQGSCCSQMDLHRYTEQIEGLRKYKNIKEIPPDPYDIETELAKKMMSHYGDKLTSKQQKAYDFAMQNSKENGPCCCKCWRWYVYGGLAKYLIQNYNFSGEQVTEVWNLSDGCGGPGDHVNH